MRRAAEAGLLLVAIFLAGLGGGSVARAGATSEPEGPGTVGLKVTGGPRGIVSRHYATFHFTANAGASDFECKLDQRPSRPCSSPVTFRHLRSGPHTLQIGASIERPDGGEGATALLRWTIR